MQKVWLDNRPNVPELKICVHICPFFRYRGKYVQFSDIGRIFSNFCTLERKIPKFIQPQMHLHVNSHLKWFLFPNLYKDHHKVPNLYNSLIFSQFSYIRLFLSDFDMATFIFSSYDSSFESMSRRPRVILSSGTSWCHHNLWFSASHCDSSRWVIYHESFCPQGHCDVIVLQSFKGKVTSSLLP